MVLPAGSAAAAAGGLKKIDTEPTACVLMGTDTRHTSPAGAAAAASLVTETAPSAMAAEGEEALAENQAGSNDRELSRGSEKARSKSTVEWLVGFGTAAAQEATDGGIRSANKSKQRQRA